MMMAWEFGTSVKNTRYFFIFGMVFSDRTIFFCSCVRNEACGAKEGVAPAGLSMLAFALSLTVAPTGSDCSFRDTGVLTPISATSCAAPTIADST